MKNLILLLLAFTISATIVNAQKPDSTFNPSTYQWEPAQENQPHHARLKNDFEFFQNDASYSYEYDASVVDSAIQKIRLFGFKNFNDPENYASIEYNESESAIVLDFGNGILEIIKDSKWYLRMPVKVGEGYEVVTTSGIVTIYKNGFIIAVFYGEWEVSEAGELSIGCLQNLILQAAEMLPKLPK